MDQIDLAKPLRAARGRPIVRGQSGKFGGRAARDGETIAWIVDTFVRAIETSDFERRPKATKRADAAQRDDCDRFRYVRQDIQLARGFSCRFLVFCAPRKTS